MLTKLKKSVAIIVAHPDDETLWAGGTILSYPTYNWYIISLCRGNDPDRAPKFFKALKVLNAKGKMGCLDDETSQESLKQITVETKILSLLSTKHFDMIITHNPKGEYTRHKRHEEVGKAVINLWYKNKISANLFWIFAYEDGNKKYLPQPIEKASIYNSLPQKIWKRKHKIITEVYGFENESWEAKTTPQTESFWQFTDPKDAMKWLGTMHEEVAVWRSGREK